MKCVEGRKGGFGRSHLEMDRAMLLVSKWHHVLMIRETHKRKAELWVLLDSWVGSWKYVAGGRATAVVVEEQQEEEEFG